MWGTVDSQGSSNPPLLCISPPERRNGVLVKSDTHVLKDGLWDRQRRNRSCLAMGLCTGRHRLACCRPLGPQSLRVAYRIAARLASRLARPHPQVAKWVFGYWPHSSFTSVHANRHSTGDFKGFYSKSGNNRRNEILCIGAPSLFLHPSPHHHQSRGHRRERSPR